MPMIEPIPTRPPFRYYGGKWKIGAAIVAAMPAHEVYVEPFGGAASVLLQKPRATCEIYNDAWGDVVNVMRMLRERTGELVSLCELTPYARDEFALSYEPCDDPLESARRFLFRNAACVGVKAGHRRSGFRTTRQGHKYGRGAVWATLPDQFAAIASRLQGVIIENRDACQVMREHDEPHTLHYVDPPYLADVRKDRTKAYTHEMLGEDEHLALLTTLRSLRGRVILSGYPHELYQQHLADWYTCPLRARDQSGQHREERLWMNFEPRGELI